MAFKYYPEFFRVIDEERGITLERGGGLPEGYSKYYLESADWKVDFSGTTKIDRDGPDTWLTWRIYRLNFAQFPGSEAELRQLVKEAISVEQIKAFGIEPDKFTIEI